MNTKLKCIVAASHQVVKCTYFSFGSFIRWVSILFFSLSLWRFKINSEFSFDSHHRLPYDWLKFSIIRATTNKPSTKWYGAMSQASHPTENQIRESHTDAQTVQCLACALCLCWITPEEIIIIMFWCRCWSRHHSSGATFNEPKENLYVLILNAVAFTRNWTETRRARGIQRRMHSKRFRLHYSSSRLLYTQILHPFSV